MGAAFSAGQVSADFVYNEMDRQFFTREQADALMDRAGVEVRTRIVNRVTARIGQGVVSAVQSGYKTGAISREGATDSLRAAGLSEDQTIALLAVVDAQARTALVQTAVTAVKGAFLRAELTVDQAAIQLASLGVQEPRLSEYLASWRLLLTGRRKTATLAQILRWFKRGLLPAAVARQRLLNLGWVDPDAMLLLAEAQLALQESEGRRARALENDARRRAKELERLLGETDRQRRKLEADVRRIRPVGTTKALWVKGIISDTDARGYLLAAGKPSDEVDRLLALWSDDKVAYDAKAAKKAAGSNPPG